LVALARPACLPPVHRHASLALRLTGAKSRPEPTNPHTSLLLAYDGV
jgi:hypothetical protein